VKYQNGKSKLILNTSEKKTESMLLNEINDETDQHSQTLSTKLTDTIETNTIKTNNFMDFKDVNVIASKVRVVMNNKMY